jgi:hypothetical protein
MARPEDINSPHARLTGQFAGNLASIQRACGGLRRQARAIRDTGARVDRDWQGLRAHYEAPESARTSPASGMISRCQQTVTNRIRLGLSSCLRQGPRPSQARTSAVSGKDLGVG